MATLIKNLPHIIALVVLIFILLFLLANFGYIRACDVPGFKDIYYSVKGYPQTAMISGDWDLRLPDSQAGMGNPELLRNTIIQRTHIFPAKINLEDLKTGGILDRYQLVIVERAKQIDTSTLQSFRDYVQKGGQLVWIGDAGTGLGSNDYVCEQVSFAYLPAANVTGQNNQTTIQCSSQWVTQTPNDPENVEGGLCGKTVADVVLSFVRQNKTIYDQATQGQIFLCPLTDITTKPYQIRGADRIQKCISDVTHQGFILDRSNITNICSTGLDYWDRGNTLTDTGKLVQKFDFGSVILGLDYVGQAPVTGRVNLFLQPVDPTHILIRGYSTRTDILQWFGEAPFSIVDTTGYEFRTSSIMNIKLDNDVYPAIVVSSPVGPLLSKKGLITYYAFPPEVGVESGRGVNLVDNLIDFSICL